MRSLALLYGLHCFGHPKGSDFGVFFKKPTLDHGISKRFTVAFGDDTHIGILLIVRDPRLFRPVGQDVVLHIVVGQTPVAILVAVGANVALHNGIGRIIAADRLELSVFGACGVGSIFGKSPIHNNGAVDVIDSERIDHSNIPLSNSRMCVDGVGREVRRLSSPPASQQRLSGGLHDQCETSQFRDTARRTRL